MYKLNYMTIKRNPILKYRAFLNYDVCSIVGAQQDLVVDLMIIIISE